MQWRQVDVQKKLLSFSMKMLGHLSNVENIHKAHFKCLYKQLHSPLKCLTMAVWRQHPWMLSTPLSIMTSILDFYPAFLLKYDKIYKIWQYNVQLLLILKNFSIQKQRRAICFKAEVFKYTHKCYLYLNSIFMSYPEN